jgi:kynurenine formamidase
VKSSGGAWTKEINMEIQYFWNQKQWKSNLNQAKDISIPLIPGKMTPNCFYAPFFDARPFRSGDFIGSIEKGAPVNFYNISMNPHGNGTHTECVRHIANVPVTIHECLQNFHFVGELISVFPQLMPNGDKVITAESLAVLGKTAATDVLILRTLPNDEGKMDKNYSGNNPTYVEKEAITLFNSWGVKHLMLDLPSVDREEDGGKLEGHHMFWKNGDEWFTEKTITEMVFVPNQIKDGIYLVQISVISLQLDVSPSKILLYEMKEVRH